MLTGIVLSFAAGYFAGGRTAVAGVTTVNKFKFPDETRTTLATGLSVGRRDLAGMANSGVAGYIGGGGAIVDKFAKLVDVPIK
jgi:hypothetical protein